MSMFTLYQHQQVLKILDKSIPEESNVSANLVGNYFFTRLDFVVQWIVDTEATYHIIVNPNLLQNEGLVENRPG